MCFVFKQECSDCQKYMRTGDFFHSKEVWDRFHNCGWTDGISDWQPREELTEMLENSKKVWLKVKEYERVAKENYVSNELPEWKVEKIISKRGLK